MKNNENKKMEMLEKELSHKLEVYKDFQKSDSNEYYFNNLHNRTMNKLESKKNKKSIYFKPAISYAFLFVITFVVSFLWIDFSNDEIISEENYLFSETSLWLEEENYFSNVVSEDFSLDYVSYINTEMDYSGIDFLNNEIIQLSDIELNEIYENIKNKKIL